jgi:hypothetical protein
MMVMLRNLHGGSEPQGLPSLGTLFAKKHCNVHRLKLATRATSFRCAAFRRLFRREHGLVTTHITKEPIGPRLFTRAEALAVLKIGETTLFWLQRTGKLRPIRIGSRVLFNAAEIRRIVAHGATLTEAEKEAATKRTPSDPIATRRNWRPERCSATSPVRKSSGVTS